MGSIERQVRKAQRRLWLNRWLGQWGWMMTFVTVGWILLLVTDRLFSLKWPMGAVALVGVGLSFIGSILWLIFTRDPSIAAATELDRAAGLRERVSTGLNLRPDSKDPFESAVVSDAEHAVAGLTPRKFLPVRWASSLTLACIMLVVASLTLLLPEFDLLNKAEAVEEGRAREALIRRVSASVAKPVSALQEVANKNPDFEMEDDLKRLDESLGDRKGDPGLKRREVLKQINRLQDALQKKAGADRFSVLKETKKRLRQVGAPNDPKSELTELMENLSTGDFDQAEKEIKKLQEKLAKRARDNKIDPEKLKQMQQQLKELSEKMKEAAQDKQSQQELQNSGLTKEEAKRVLDALSKKDPEQLEKLAKELSQRLKDKGISQEQMKEMLQKMQQRQKASQQCQKMGDKMGQCSKAMEQGNLGEAQQQLGEAGEMLNEMEQMEQALNDLESQMSQLDQAQDDLSDFDPEKDDLSCQQCNDTGFRPDGAPCPRCNGQGAGGNRGRGWGDRERDNTAETSTVNRKAKTKQGRGGSIVGQQFVKGKQLKGKSQVEFSDALGAGEIDRADTMNRDRIPRVYRKGIKRFFDRLGEDFQPAQKSREPGASKEPEESDTDGKKTESTSSSAD
ncbi:MAG: hypothetical protein MI923_04340 [Phycisphaerales bacterium]|nr:hypothetical protein [Phycisphaerales bacterium]